MERANSTCLSVRLPWVFSDSSFERISRLFSGVRSSWLILARNSDLYLDVSASCSAFSSSSRLACSTSRFLASTCVVLHREQARLVFQLEVLLLQFVLLGPQQLFRLTQRLGLALQAVVGLLQLFLLRLELGGQELRLLEQAFGAHVRRDRVEHDADQFHELVQERLVRLAEPAERGELDHRVHVAFEQRRQHDHVERRRFAQAGADLHVIVRHVGQQDARLLVRALADQALAQAELVREMLAVVEGIARGKRQDRVAFLVAVGDVEHAVLRVHQRRQLREHHVRHGRKIALALQHAGEPREVGLQPVLLGVLLRLIAQIADHLVDVVFQRGHFAQALPR